MKTPQVVVWTRGILFEPKETGTFKGNVGYAIAAQVVSLGSSVLTSLVVPKILGVESFGYWQLFVMYVGYMGILLFGIHDGVFLRLGGERIDHLDRSRVKAEYLLVLVFQVIVAVFITLFALFSGLDNDRVEIFALVCLCAMLVNPAQFLFYIFRAVNIPNLYSRATLASQSAYTVFLLVAVSFQLAEYRAYLVAYICAQSVAIVICYLYARPILKVSTGKMGLAMRDVAEDVKAGMKVTLAYYAGTLVVGIGRMMIDAHWGIEAFGKFSFSISLVNFLLAFAAQVAMVAFPVVKRMDGEKSKEVFLVMRRILFVLMPLVYVLYYPACILLEIWLPQYSDSLRYLAIILPICVFDFKIQLLVNTYLKALRKENAMLWINASCLIFSAALTAIGVFVIGNIYWAAGLMVLSIAIRSCVAEAYLSKFIGGSCIRYLASEIALAVFFVASALAFSSPLPTCVAVLVYYAVNAKQLKIFVHDVRRLVGGCS